MAQARVAPSSRSRPRCKTQREPGSLHHRNWAGTLLGAELPQSWYLRNPATGACAKCHVATRSTGLPGWLRRARYQTIAWVDGSVELACHYPNGAPGRSQPAPRHHQVSAAYINREKKISSLWPKGEGVRTERCSCRVLSSCSRSPNCPADGWGPMASPHRQTSDSHSRREPGNVGS